MSSCFPVWSITFLICLLTCTVNHQSFAQTAYNGCCVESNCQKLFTSVYSNSCKSLCCIYCKSWYAMLHELWRNNIQIVPVFQWNNIYGDMVMSNCTLVSSHGISESNCNASQANQNTKPGFCAINNILYLNSELGDSLYVIVVLNPLRTNKQPIPLLLLFYCGDILYGWLSTLSSIALHAS